MNMNFLMRGWLCLGVLLWPVTGTPKSPALTALLESEPASLVQVREWMQAGRLAEAGQEIARQLQKPAPDPQFQLLQCVVLAHQNQTAKAISCLNALVKAQPDMLEAYNNLGVLHASLGQHDEARRWLNLAMQRVPALWTVHQNMQNLQLEVSRKAYASALQTELPLKATPPKLTLLASTSLGNQEKKPKSAANDAPTAAKASPPPSADSAAITAQTTVLPPPPVQVLAQTPAPAPAPQSEPPKRESKKSEQMPLDEDTRKQVQADIEAWARAWSEKNMPQYFAAYTPDFSVGKGSGRAAWEAERTSRIVGRRFVRVSVRQFSFEKEGPKVVARFSQVYESDNIFSTHRKRLDLVRHEGHWKIERENVIGQ